MKIGYARVSTGEQNLDLQLDRLRDDGCVELFSDKGVSGAATKRAGLDDALARLQAGDILVVWKLDRLGRSLTHLIGLLEELKGRGVEFRSLTDSIDTTTASGKLHFTMIAALAEFERGIISERTREGLRAAKDRGAKFGRKRVLTHKQASMAKELIDGGTFRKDVAKSFGVSLPTLRRALRDYGLEER
ncbi:Resolvase domain protein [Stappia sp. 22II-S9-Z10]|nr:Resolvase domain protein [Stappia sp. 22II-S9-Z10]